MATLCLSIVAGLAASQLLARRRPKAVMWITALLAVGLLSDGWATIAAVPAPRPFPDEAVLRDQMVLALPVGALEDFGPQLRAVVSGSRSLNGYSGYEPKHYEALRQGVRFEVDGVFAPFRARGDLFVVVGTDHPRLVSLVERQAGAMCVAERQGVRQYRLPRLSPPLPAVADGPVLRIAQATASCTSAAAAIDGDSSTRWVCGPQSGAEWFMADLGVVTDRVGAVRYTMGESYREFPRVLVVETSVDGETWEPAWNGDVIAPTIEGSLRDPLAAPVTLPFAPRRARYVRLRQTGKDDVNWALPELAVLASG
jgi:hypothetical protein